ncbi:hypothetical protein ACIL82_11230 [Enterococcus faecium]
MYKSGDYSIKEIIETNQISTGTFYREINRLKLKKLNKKRTTNVIYRQLFVFLPLFLYRCSCDPIMIDKIKCIWYINPSV